MTTRNYATALTHAVLAGTSIWCIYQTHGNDKWRFATGSFGVVAVNSLLGVWRYGNPDYGYKVDNIFRITNFCARILALPAVATNIYLNYGIDWYFSIIHIGVAAIPATLYALDEYVEESLVDLILLGNCISMGYQTWSHTNYYGMYATACGAVNHFILHKQSFSDAPMEMMYNLGMCFYTYFAYKALSD